MHRIPRRRLALAATALGAVVVIAVPQWVAAGSGDPVPAAPDAPAALGPAPTSEAAPADSAAPAAQPPVTARDEEPAAPPAPSVAPPAQPATPDVPPPVVVPEAPPAAPTPTAPPADAEPVADPGTLTVEVAPAEGTTRSVWLRTAAGTPVGDPQEVTGAPVVFTDLEAGAYDLLVEQFADGGGAFLTRTSITITAGADTLATCDADTLECSAS